jgi:hypothetical protein
MIGARDLKSSFCARTNNPPRGRGYARYVNEPGSNAEAVSCLLLPSSLYP